MSENDYGYVIEHSSLDVFIFWHKLYYHHYVPPKYQNNFLWEIVSCVIHKNRLDILAYLLDQKYNFNKNIIDEALVYGRIKICKYLLNHGYKFNQDSLECALHSRKFHVLDFLLENYNIDLPKESNENNMLALSVQVWLKMRAGHTSVIVDGIHKNSFFKKDIVHDNVF